MENEIIRFLSKHVTLSEEEEQAILELDLGRFYKKGTILLKEGQTSNSSYFVFEGCVKAYYLIDGEEKITAFYTEGESIEPVSYVTKRPSEYYLECLEDCLLNTGNSEIEEKIIGEHPGFEIVCRVMSSQMLAKKQIDFDYFKNSSPEERYVHLSETRPDLVQRVPQYQLASYIGLKPESLSRIRKRLVNA